MVIANPDRQDDLIDVILSGERSLTIDLYTVKKHLDSYDKILIGVPYPDSLVAPKILTIYLSYILGFRTGGLKLCLCSAYTTYSTI